MIKNILTILTVLLLASGISATSEQINETLYIYGESSGFFRPSDINKNIDKVVCINATCTESSIAIGTNRDYELDYELNYAPNETIYYAKIITLKQEEYDSLFFGTYKKHKRTLYIDAVEVSSYNITSVVAMSARNTFSFKTLDQTITFGSDTISNATFFFTELIMDDQYDLINNSTSGTISVHNRFLTIGINSDHGHKLGGLTGIFMNILKRIPMVGTSIYNIMI